jgi:hypothetical protein
MYEQDDLDTIDEDEDYRGAGSGGSSRGSSLGDSSTDDDMKDWPEDDAEASAEADKAVHLEGLPRSDTRLAAR